VLALIAGQPDLTLLETVAELRKRRIRTSRGSLWRFLGRHSITLKKVCKLPNGSEQMWRERVSLRIARDIGFRLKHRASRAGGYQESSALQRSGSMLRSSSRAPHGGSPRSMLDRSCGPRLWSPLLP
jgi:hypothetical protein